MATQPHGHPVLSTEHVTSPQASLPLPQSPSLNFPDAATSQNPNSNSLRSPLPASSHLSPSFNSKINTPSSISPPPNVVTRDLLTQSPDPAPSSIDSPPERPKIDIAPPELPRSQPVVDALLTSASQPSHPAPLSPKVRQLSSSSPLEIEQPQPLSKRPRQNVREEPPESGSTSESSSCQSPAPTRTATNEVSETCTRMHIEEPLNVATMSEQDAIVKQPAFLFSEKQNDQDCLNRKRVSSSSPSSVSAGNDATSKDSHAREPDTKRLKSHQYRQTSVLSDPSNESALVIEKESNGSGSVKKDVDMMKDDESIQKGKPANVSASPSIGASLPLLRSSPVLLGHGDRAEIRSLESKHEISEVERNNAGSLEQKDLDVEMKLDEGQQTPGGEHVNATTATKKKKTVSWAPKDKLVDVQFIDNRMELVRSWDIDSQVTLPFAPATLLMFQQALKEQDVAKHNAAHNGGKGAETVSLRSMPKLTSFKEARKREHDMEQERARQAREELKERLSAMTASAPWKTPTAIVLPAECRIEEGSLERFNLPGLDSYPEGIQDPDTCSPPSPPRQSNELFDTSSRAIVNVPVIPLSDRFSQNGENEFESLSTTGGTNSRHYTRPEPYHDYFRQNHNRRRPNEDNGADFKASPNSSKQHHYPNSRNSPVDSSGLNVGSDSRNKPRGQFDAMQIDYSEASPTPSPSQAHAVQHLLSALQSSGLLKQGNGLASAKNHSADHDMTSNSDDARRISDGSYKEAQQGNQHDRRNRDNGGTFDNESGENDRPEKGPTSQEQDLSSSTPDGNMQPPMMGHSITAPFPPGIQQPGVMDMMPFPGPMGHPPMGIPPMGLPPPGSMPLGAMPPPPPPPPPPHIGIPPPLGMLQMMGVHMPLMSMPPGMQMSDNGQVQSTPNNGGHSGTSSGRSGAGRGVETISRPKPKPMKQRKRCKYFGTKQGCRDGNSCMFAHN